MNFEDLSPELREKALLCKTPDELLQLAESAGIELSDKQLEAVSGGALWDCDDECSDYYGDADW